MLAICGECGIHCAEKVSQHSKEILLSRYSACLHALHSGEKQRAHDIIQARVLCDTILRRNRLVNPTPLPIDLHTQTEAHAA